jgi:hypothetical protein
MRVLYADHMGLRDALDIEIGGEECHPFENFDFFLFLSFFSFLTFLLDFIFDFFHFSSFER